MQKQQHIQMLFSLLERKDHILNDIEFGYTDKSYTEKRKGQRAVWAMKNNIESNFRKYTQDGKLDPLVRKSLLKDLFSSSGSSFIIYFRTFAESIKFLDQIKEKSPKDKLLKEQLTDLYRANIGNSERRMLNYLLEHLSNEELDNNLSKEERRKTINCRKRIESLNVIPLSKENIAFMEAKRSE